MVEKIDLNQLPDRVYNLVMQGDLLPIIVFWNSPIVFSEVYRALKVRLRQNIGSFEERAGAALFLVNDKPAVRFLPEPEFSWRFQPGTIVDVSIYHGTLEKHPVEHIRQNEIRQLQESCNAKALKTWL